MRIAGIFTVDSRLSDFQQYAASLRIRGKCYTLLMTSLILIFRGN